MEEMLEQVFGNLQRLEIQPTEHNVALLGECFRVLREIHGKAQEMGRKGPQEAAQPAGDLHIVRDEETATEAENGEE